MSEAAMDAATEELLVILHFGTDHERILHNHGVQSTMECH